MSRLLRLYQSKKLMGERGEGRGRWRRRRRKKKEEEEDITKKKKKYKKTHIYIERQLNRVFNETLSSRRILPTRDVLEKVSYSDSNTRERVNI